jgi:hypothetical protein
LCGMSGVASLCGDDPDRLVDVAPCVVYPSRHESSLSSRERFLVGSRRALAIHGAPWAP